MSYQAVAAAAQQKERIFAQANPHSLLLSEVSNAASVLNYVPSNGNFSRVD